MNAKDKYNTLLMKEEAQDTDLNGLLAELAMHGYRVGVETHFDFIYAKPEQVIYVVYADKYAYAKAPCKLTIDYHDILLSLLESVNQMLQNEAEA